MTNFGSRTVLLVALIAATVAGVATYGVSAITNPGKTEVRISAQRLENGIIEFALQQRADDGSWGDRILPAARKLSAEGRLHRWANSTPIEIDAGLPFYLNTTEPQRSVTVQEYVALCGDEAALFEETGISIDEETLSRYSAFGTDESEPFNWGQLLFVIDLSLTARQSIDPPAELAEFHEGQISSLTLIAQYSFAQDPEMEFSEWDLFGIAFLAAAVSAEAEQNLTPELRQQLIDGGCIEADESETSE